MHYAALENEAAFPNSNLDRNDPTPSAREQHSIEINPRKNALKGIILGALICIPVWTVIFVLAVSLF